jgi:hypothetical protein
MLLSVLLLSLLRPSPGIADDVRPPSQDWKRRLEKLRSIPYVDVSPEPSPPGEKDVVLNTPDRAWYGYNFYCSRSAGRIFLMDMNGETLHQWIYKPKKGAGSDHAQLLDNGDILVVLKHEKLLLMDWNSRLLWERKLRAHHDLALASDGSMYVIVRDWEAYRGMRVWFDVLLHLTEDGEELDRWHTFDRLSELKAALDPRAFLDTVLDSALGGGSDTGLKATVVKEKVADDRYNFDYFHLNTVGLLPDNPLGSRDHRFRPGNLLVCLRNVNQIVILEPGTYRILWSWGQGVLQWPHHPTMLPNGHILVFDNGVHRKYSRVLELDPQQEAIVWEYRAPVPEDFFSARRGSAQRLPNGNTLVTESDRGRVFEVTADGQPVWIWLNPERKKDHRQTIYRMVRLPVQMVEPLLREWWWWE